VVESFVVVVVVVESVCVCVCVFFVFSLVASKTHNTFFLTRKTRRTKKKRKAKKIHRQTDTLDFVATKNARTPTPTHTLSLSLSFSHTHKNSLIMGFSSFFKTPPPQTEIERRRTVVCKSIYALCHIYEEQKKGVFRKYNTHTHTHTHTKR